jgi:hypothetical protein
MLNGKLKFFLALTMLMFVAYSCKHTRYREPKKPHNSYKPGKKNKWMDQKRDNMRQF